MNNTWKQRREGGGWFAIWLIRGIGRYGGRALARLFLFPITAYFLLPRTADRRDSRPSLTRLPVPPATFGSPSPSFPSFSTPSLSPALLPCPLFYPFSFSLHFFPPSPPPSSP